MKRRTPFDIQFLLEELTNNKPSVKLDEDPDGVVRAKTDGGGISWSDGDNLAFIALKNFSMVYAGSTHRDIWKLIKKTHDRGEMSVDILEGEGVLVSNAKEFVKDVFDDGIGVINKVLTGRTIGNFRNKIDGILTGRIWTGEWIISFWNEQDDVIRHWDFIEKMYSEFPDRLGELRIYNVDWVERDSEEAPLTPASDVSRSGNKTHDPNSYLNEPEVDEEGQINFLAKMFRDPIILDKLSDAQLDKLIGKIHVLDPEVKAQVMKAAGNSLVNKAGEIATKLGMSVAEFNSIWNMDESKISESPDAFIANKKQRDIFASKGVNAAMLSKIAYYDSPDAVGFLIDIAKNITIYNPPGMGEVRLTHPDMGVMIMGYNAYPNDYDKFPVNGSPGFAIDLKPDVEVSPGNDVGVVAVLQSNSIPSLVNSLKILVNDLPLDGDVPRSSKAFIQGRIWKNSNVISVWSPKDFIISNFSLVDDLLVGLKLDKSKMVYEFIDSKHLYSYDELTGKNVETRSREEMQRLIAMKHVVGGMAQKVPKKSLGFDFDAQRNAAMPALEGNIKLSSLLKEDPDRLTITADSHAIENLGLKAYSSFHWKDLDTITFFFDVSEKRILWIAADEVMIARERYAGRPTHSSIVRQIAYYRKWPENCQIVRDAFGGFSLESKPTANFGQTWFSEGGVHGTDFTSKEDFDAYLAMAEWTNKVDRKSLPSTLLIGRYWKNSKAISFWQSKSEILKEFPMVERILGIFGVKPDDAAYEFIDIRKVFVYDELFQEDDVKFKRDADEIADLLKRQHTDPSAKKRLKDLGYYDKVKAPEKGMGGFDLKVKRDAAIPPLQELVKKINSAK